MSVSTFMSRTVRSNKSACALRPLPCGRPCQRCVSKRKVASSSMGRQQPCEASSLISAQSQHSRRLALLSGAISLVAWDVVAPSKVWAADESKAAPELSPEEQAKARIAAMKKRKGAERVAAGAPVATESEASRAVGMKKEEKGFKKEETEEEKAERLAKQAKAKLRKQQMEEERARVEAERAAKSELPSGGKIA
eukprot:CAMPEP_0198708082 /NCGR_PEP_ID=MMETSP1471-20131121/831_1 /TAXON_ID=41880 /ORGANISM="Pycnococcus provasolii, Strain RCC733" /LENGTH=194 /DNA_ID=CAMNT_0044467267 /DNA_START=87 /DNA_END=671 /DNA_ORIENTATION=-